MIIAWESTSGSETVIPEPPIWQRREYDSGTILYSINHGQLSSHCCSNFWVVWIVTNGNQGLVQRYSSELGKWEDWIEPTEMLAKIDRKLSTLIGDILYWPRMNSRYIIVFDNVTTKLCYIECPHETHDISRHNFVIAKGHNGDVALAVIRYFSLNTLSSARSSTGK